MHADWGKGGGGEKAHRETRHMHAGFDCTCPPTQAGAILDHGQSSVSLCA